MSRHDDIVSLGHMVQHAREALGMIEDKTRQDVIADRMLQLALARLLEIVGEAASRVSDSMRQKTPEIPWAKIRGMRNRLIHGHDHIDLDVLWDTMTLNLPPLVESLERVLSKHNDGGNA